MTEGVEDDQLGFPVEWRAKCSARLVSTQLRVCPSWTRQRTRSSFYWYGLPAHLPSWPIHLPTIPVDLHSFTYQYVRLIQRRRRRSFPPEQRVVVHLPQGTLLHGTSRVHVSCLTSLIVNRLFQWRPLLHDRSSLYPRHNIPYRVLCLLDRTSTHLRCASVRARPRKACPISLEVVPYYTEAVIQQ